MDGGGGQLPGTVAFHCIGSARLGALGLSSRRLAGLQLSQVFRTFPRVDLRLEYCPNAERDGRHRYWDEWRVVDGDGMVVGYVAEYHPWQGTAEGPALYEA